jgi:hypothetical protein
MDAPNTLEELRPRIARTPLPLRPAPRPSPRIRWLGGAVLATAVVIGGLTLWVFDPPERATAATVAVAPTPRTNDLGIEPAATERGTPSSDERSPVVETTPELDPTPSAGTRRLSTEEPSRPEPTPPRPSNLAVPINVAASSPHGTLIINTIPWTHVHIDGRDTGRNTPIRALRVTPGRHVLRLVTQSGHVSVIDVDIAAGERQGISRRIRAGERLPGDG